MALVSSTMAGRDREPARGEGGIGDPMLMAADPAEPFRRAPDAAGYDCQIPLKPRSCSCSPGTSLQPNRSAWTACSRTAPLISWHRTVRTGCCSGAEDSRQSTVKQAGPRPPGGALRVHNRPGGRGHPYGGQHPG
jgi:hypothetical protein